MVLTSDYSAGADGIGARPGIERLADLKGRKLGLPKGTYTEFLVNLILAREGFQAGEVELVDMQAEKAVTTLTGGTVDAVATFEPFLGEAIAATKGRLLWDSRQLAGLIPSGITFRRQFLSERPGDVQKLVAVWQRASTFIAEHPDEAYAIVARLNKVTPAEARAMAAKDHLLDLQGNLTAFSYAAGFDSLHGTARVMNDFLIKQNLATNRLDSATFLDARFLKALKSYDSAP
jgi:NitT/TauT family transport system substrate-binding protein